MVRVVRLGAANAKEAVPAGEEGEIAALLAGDEFIRRLLAPA